MDTDGPGEERAPQTGSRQTCPGPPDVQRGTSERPGMWPVGDLTRALPTVTIYEASQRPDPMLSAFPTSSVSWVELGSSDTDVELYPQYL